MNTNNIEYQEKCKLTRRRMLVNEYWMGSRVTKVRAIYYNRMWRWVNNVFKHKQDSFEQFKN